MSKEDAESQLRQHDEKCYLTRYNDDLDIHVLSIKVTRKEDKPAFEHFPINILTEDSHCCYEIDGSEKAFDDISKLLDYYKNTPVNYDIVGIGECIESENYKSIHGKFPMQCAINCKFNELGNMNAVPTIGDLTQLGIVEKVSPDWRRIGCLLGQSQSALDNYERQEMRNTITCCTKVFDHWINDNGSKNYPLSWNGVNQLLCKIEHRGTAQEMKTSLHTQGQ